MKYHMDTYSLISVANYLGFLEGTGRIEIDEEMGGEDYDMADCCRIVRDFEIGSSKGELTIGKLAREEH